MPATPPNLIAHWAAHHRAALAALAGRDLAAAAGSVRELATLFDATQGPAPVRARAAAEIGDLWVLLLDYAAAHACYERALTLAPQEPRYLFNRASVRRFLGDLAGAERDYDEYLKRVPADAQAYLNRSELRPQRALDNHTAQLEEALRKAHGNWQQEVPLRYALAKEYEDLHDWQRSWQNLHAGAQLRRQNLHYDLASDLEAIGQIRSAFADPPPATGGSSNREPIFILGMPRTGSTLIDRVLGRHSQVFSAGELPDFGAAVAAAVQRRHGRAVPRAQLIGDSARLDFAALGAEYLRRTRPRTGHTSFFTDKLPINFLYCGLIARALPGARMIHVQRGPIATCYSLYKVLFDRGYPFSYDLAELADYYAGYRRLMAHWEEVLPGRLIGVEYEEFVTAPEAGARRLCAALRLPWEPEMLEFERNAEPVATASAAQVRRPLHKESLALWRRYARELEPLAARLRARGIAAES